MRGLSKINPPNPQQELSMINVEDYPFAATINNDPFAITLIATIKLIINTNTKGIPHIKP